MPDLLFFFFFWEKNLFKKIFKCYFSIAVYIQLFSGVQLVPDRIASTWDTPMNKTDPCSHGAYLAGGGGQGL